MRSTQRISTWNANAGEPEASQAAPATLQPFQRGDLLRTTAGSGALAPAADCQPTAAFVDFLHIRPAFFSLLNRRASPPPAAQHPPGAPAALHPPPPLLREKERKRGQLWPGEQ